MHLQALQELQTPREGRFSWARLLQLSGAVTLGASWLVPNHYVPWYFFHSDALACAALFMWLLALQLNGGARDAPPRVVIAVLAAVAIPWIQWVLGLIVFAGEAWVATVYLGGLAGALFIGSEWARAPQSDRLLLKTVIGATLASGLISSALGVIQWLRLEDLLGVFIANLGATARPFANLAQPNLLATLTVMSLVALVWFYHCRLIHRLAFACGILFLTVGLCLTQSRAGYVGVIVLALWWWIKQPTVEGGPIGRWWPLAWLVTLPAIAAGLHLLSAAFELADDRPVALTDNNGRWLMWKQVARGIAESPWLGYGWEHTTAAQMTGSVTYPGSLATAYAHNIALDALAWLGIPLGLLVCLAGAFWLVTRAVGARGAQPVFAFAFALPVLTHSLFEFPFAYAVFLFPAAVMLGAVEGSRGKPRRTVRWTRWGLALTLAWGALGVEVAREYAPAEDDFRFMRFEAVRMGTTPESHVRPSFVLLTQMEALLEVGRIKPAPGMSAEQIERVRAVTLKYPWAPPALLYAAALEANGRLDEAERQMRVVHGMYGNRYFADATARLEELRAGWQTRTSAPGPR